MNRLPICLCSLFVCLLSPRVSEACDGAWPTIYELVDQSSVALVIKVDLGNADEKKGISSRVTASVLDVAKGSYTAKVIEFEPGIKGCEYGFRRDERAVVFLDDKGHVNGSYYAILSLRNVDASKISAALRAWGEAADGEARANALLDGIESGGQLAGEAGDTLLDRADLLNAVSSFARDRLVKIAATQGAKGPAPSLAILARLRDSRVDALIAKKGVWRGEGIARSLRKGLSFESIDDRSALATVIARNGSIFNKITAIERCERLIGSAFASWSNEDFISWQWKELASACRGQ